MSFGLKNAGATYKRLVNKVFADQIGRNIEAYMNNKLVKSKDMSQYAVDLKKTFDTLYKYGMRLNPSKYAFKIASDKFFDFIVSHREIEANLEKI